MGMSFLVFFPPAPPALTVGCLDAAPTEGRMAGMPEAAGVPVLGCLAGLAMKLFSLLPMEQGLVLSRGGVSIGVAASRGFDVKRVTPLPTEVELYLGRIGMLESRGEVPMGDPTMMRATPDTAAKQSPLSDAAFTKLDRQCDHM